MLEDIFTSLATVKTSDELLRQAVAFTHRLGFQTVTASAVRDRPCDLPEFAWVDNASALYRALPGYLTDGRREPVLHILAISEQTVVRHLGNASRKLGCVTKHQAVVKALRRGLRR